MSEYLGFAPSENPIYYFLSYNSEDKEKVGEIAKTMMHSGINLWYDYGIDYGEKWEETIAKKIKNSQGVLLLFTKGILSKYNSYVQKEYKIAKYLNRKVYIALVDQIKEDDVPIEKIPWWIDINENQTINLFEISYINIMVEKLSVLLGVQHYEDKMNIIINKYNELYFEGRVDEAGIVLEEYLHSISLKGKVEVIANIVMGGFQNTNILSPSISVSHLDTKLRTHTGEFKETFYECKKLTVKKDTFIVGNDFIFHRGKMGDAHVIWIWRNGELIHTIGGLIDANKLEVYWDSFDCIIYIVYLSDKETRENGQDIVSETFLSVTTIENPNEMPVCTDFKFIRQ